MCAQAEERFIRPIYDIIINGVAKRQNAAGFIWELFQNRKR